MQSFSLNEVHGNRIRSDLQNKLQIVTEGAELHRNNFAVADMTDFLLQQELHKLLCIAGKLPDQPGDPTGSVASGDHAGCHADVSCSQSLTSD